MSSMYVILKTLIDYEIKEGPLSKEYKSLIMDMLNHLSAVDVITLEEYGELVTTLLS